VTERFKRTLEIIGRALRSVREEEFDGLYRACLEALDAGGKIIASGLGKNVPICEKFVGTLNAFGIPALFMHTNSAAHGDLGVVRDGDLVILLTKSGETGESVYLAGLLRQRGCKCWLLSFNRDSTMYAMIPGRLIIQLEHEGDEWNILPNHSTVLNLLVLQELAMCIAKERRVPLETVRRNHPGGAIGFTLAQDEGPF
jgi:arabinose-5-phosphate isomerase